MGSPNFCTNNILLNFATLPTDNDDDYEYDLSDTKQSIESDIANLDELSFHTIKIEYGYHEGFQVMLTSDADLDYINQSAVDWQKYKECIKPDGNEFDMLRSKFVPANVVNITKHNLTRIIRNEYKYIHNALLKIAKDYGLGEVHGKSWTSSVGDISTKEIT